MVMEEPPGHAIHTTHVSPSNHNHSCRSSLAEQEHSLLPGHKGASDHQKNTVEPCCAHDTVCASASYGHPSLHLCFFFPRCVLINHYSGFLEHHLFHCAPQPPLMDGGNTLRLGVSSPVCVCTSPKLSPSSSSHSCIKAQSKPTDEWKSSL